MRLTNKKYYQIDFDKLILLLLPTFLRKSKLVAFVSILIAPIKKMYQEFRKQQKKDWYRLNHNGQVFSLRKALNDAFDNELRRIEIVDYDKYKRIYIYTHIEKRPLYLGKQYIYTTAEYEGSIDFVVIVPSDLDYNAYQMRDLINEYKLVTKKYIIKNG